VHGTVIRTGCGDRLAHLTSWAAIAAVKLRRLAAWQLIYRNVCAAGAALVIIAEVEPRRTPMWWNDYWPWPWMFFGPVMMLLFVAICVVMIWLMMRGGMTHRERGGSRAIDILNERYARGEINQAEYQERRRLLES
jgi:putative membrane protein